jgi:hypothetical protein
MFGPAGPWGKFPAARNNRECRRPRRHLKIAADPGTILSTGASSEYWQAFRSLTSVLNAASLRPYSAARASTARLLSSGWGPGRLVRRCPSFLVHAEEQPRPRTAHAERLRVTWAILMWTALPAGQLQGRSRCQPSVVPRHRSSILPPSRRRQGTRPIGQTVLFPGPARRSSDVPAMLGGSPNLPGQQVIVLCRLS